jgi:hypothetical protein
MADHPDKFPKTHDDHAFRVVREKINIFTDVASREIIDGIEDNQKVVFISIGPGETRISVLDDEGRSVSAWTAVFGWSSLCDIEVDDKSGKIHLASVSMLTKALRSSLRVYGKSVDTKGFIAKSRTHLSGALSHIIDQTIGDAREFDRIILAASPWMHDALSECLEIRPHIDPVIQDL